MKRRHGSPYDRGSADRYYGREFSPHFFEGSSYSSKRILRSEMTPEQVMDYQKGWDEETDRKDWGSDWGDWVN
jgi:hypothetical protein